MSKRTWRRPLNINRTEDGRFEWGYIPAYNPNLLYDPAKPAEEQGRVADPHYWWAHRLGDGTEEFFDSKQECLAWIDAWRRTHEKPSCCPLPL